MSRHISSVRSLFHFCLISLVLSLPAYAQDAVAEAPQSLADQVNNAFNDVNGALIGILFFDVSFGGLEGTDAGSFPLIVSVLFLGAIFFSIRYGFIQFRLMGHAFQVIRGKYDSKEDHGEISHFQALTSALSATVGLGNIAGVAVAISLGGAGAVFWMWMVAVFGMASKFSSCTLAQLYRRVTPDPRGGDHIEGGPMVYLEEGIKEQLSSWGPASVVLGKLFGISFAIFAIFGSLGGGNMFQANQTFEIVSYVVLGPDHGNTIAWIGGVIMATLVGLVVAGGIRRIGEVTSKIVPGMCAFYVIVCMIILFSNAAEIPSLLASIFREAWDIKSMGWGGFASLMVIGVKRGAFSNEAGLGSAAIAHSAAKTNEPVREGLVAMVGPFIDTIVICTMTALTILITKAHIPDGSLEAIAGSDIYGAAMTAKAFGTLHSSLPYFLCIAVFVFAYSTMISWYYYGERSIEYLFGRSGIIPFRVIFLSAIVIAPVATLANVILFTDLLILSMAYPNVLGMIILSPIVVKAAKDYVSRLKSGEIKPPAK